MKHLLIGTDSTRSVQKIPSKEDNLIIDGKKMLIIALRYKQD